jgi:glycosyltransferase involved in cell wall biosynthesis
VGTFSRENEKMISGVVLTKNEDKNIEDCLKSLSWCDELIVLDDNSTDKTQELAQKMGAKVFVRELDNDFSDQRNFGLEKAKGDWVLFLDADERVSEVLRGEIQSIILDTKNNGFFIKRHDVWKGKTLTHGEVGSIKLLRLARKGFGSWTRKVHEVWNIKEPVANLKHPILHYPHQTVSEFVESIDKYSTLHAEEKLKNKETSNLFRIIFYPIFKFIQNYLLRLGFLDGTQGFLYAALMSFHSYLSWSKLWLKQRK